MQYVLNVLLTVGEGSRIFGGRTGLDIRTPVFSSQCLLTSHTTLSNSVVLCVSFHPSVKGTSCHLSTLQGHYEAESVGVS